LRFIASKPWFFEHAREEVMLMAENVQMHLEGSILVIQVDLNQSFGLSASGKSEIIASTGGNVSVPGYEAVKVGLNVYRPRTPHNGRER
jgi:hypothetical protein